MTELSKINPGPVKVTVARPIGRAASQGGGRAIEAVPPVVLDNETALGFLRDKARQEGSERSRSSDHDDTPFAEKRLSRGDRGPEGHSLERIELYERGRRSGSSFQRISPEQTLRQAAASSGFATHLMAQNGEAEAASPEFLSRQRAQRHSQSSEAYRRAGAEPLLYGQASQVVSVAI